MNEVKKIERSRESHPEETKEFFNRIIIYKRLYYAKHTLLTPSIAKKRMAVVEKKK